MTIEVPVDESFDSVARMGEIIDISLSEGDNVIFTVQGMMVGYRVEAAYDEPVRFYAIYQKLRDVLSV